MEDWLVNSSIACILYAMWTICLKLASRTIDSNTSNLIQLPIRVVVTLWKILQRSSTSKSSISMNGVLNFLGNLNLYGTIYTIVGCTCTVTAGFFYADALSSEGSSAAAVAVITGSYPALSYSVGVLLGIETISSTKVLGVCLAIASSYCFAVSS